ncbi:Holliday junction resolvase RuvX [Acidihalobacter ferrooxydans]|uniref:Putative pre-16S rRNA nuclease n=1 Tax=Acidihalobacter ferrooxydans TaxID=1765967 RepID=A0A1P8UDN8_9GAMM|nr:Holliday junction resolvase RuvX [Acidihalobacter ferrooxydans]APZ41972.1 Holliday junction resolvase RuvX [Acidihalobacter ferrooxydans]
MSGVVLCFDYGTRRTGVAVGQRLTGTARPLTTLAMPQGQPDWAAFDALLKEWRPSDLVVGRPTHLDGTASTLTATAEAFAATLRERYSLPVSMADERLSSRAAEELLREQRTDGRRGRIDKADVDRYAAALMLEDWLAQPHPATTHD